MEPIIHIRNILGQYTGDDPIRIKPQESSSFVVAARNVNIDNAFMSSRRNGSSAAIISGNSADLYSDGSFCLFRNDLALKRLQKSAGTWSASTLMTLSSRSRISYESVNHFVYLTNGTDLALISEGGVTELVPEERVLDFIFCFPAGQILCFYRGRMFLAVGNNIYISLPLDPRYIDPLDYLRYDRRDSIIPMSAYITMMRPVDDGIFIATTDQLLFASGNTPETFIPKQIADYGAIIGTDCKIDSSLLPFDGVQGTSVMFLTDRGISIGMNGGVYKNISISKLRDEAASYGAAICQYNNGIQRYLVSTTT